MKSVPLTGLIVTKLDGTSKGGTVVAIQKELGLPIKFIGLGEQPDDLQPFDAKTGNMSNAKFMRLALRFARRGYGMTSPNPMVGAVLVKGRQIIGRGWH